MKRGTIALGGFAAISVTFLAAAKFSNLASAYDIYTPKTAIEAEPGEALQPNKALVAVTAHPSIRGENVGTIFQATWPDGTECSAGVVNASQSRTGFGTRTVQFYCSGANAPQKSKIEDLDPVQIDQARIDLINANGELLELGSGARLDDDKTWEQLGQTYERNPSKRIWNVESAGSGTLTMSGNGKAVFAGRTIAEFNLSYVGSLFYNGKIYLAGRDGANNLMLGYCEWKSRGDACGPIQYEPIPIMTDVYSLTGWNGSIYLAGDHSGIVRFSYEMEVISAKAFGEFYGAVEIDDALYFGHFPSGYAFKLTRDGALADTHTPPTRSDDWQGKFRFVVDRKVPTANNQNYREAQTLYLFGGKMVVGMYPYGEIWIGQPGETNGWTYNRLFKHPADTKEKFPYLSEIRVQINKLSDERAKRGARWLYPYYLGQRVHSMAPWNDSLALGVGNTNGYAFEKLRDAFLTDEQMAEYKKVHLLANDDTSQRIYSGDKPTTFEIRSVGTRMQFAMDGVPVSRVFDMPGGEPSIVVGSGPFGRSEIELQRN